MTTDGTTDVSGTQKMHTAVLPSAQPLTPERKFHQQALKAANVSTTTSGRLFITDCKAKQRYLVDTLPDLCVFHVRCCRGAGNVLTTPFTLPMGTRSSHVAEPHGS